MSNQKHPSGRLFVISAPSGAGKTSLVKALVERSNNLVVSVSHTTRSMRPGEVDGVNYHFVSESAFTHLRDSEGFFEWAQVFDNYYGTSREGVEHQLAKGLDVILEIDWQGARQVKSLVESAVSIFVLPPSTEALRERLTGRGQDDTSVIERRMQSARDEIIHYTEADFVVLNDVFNEALSDLESIIYSQQPAQTPQSERLASVIADLLAP
ncbi:guanylate kinase [Luminiphilus sp.]|nr:guanylate kinase [Luminiphilus sp.]MDB3919002.1 guanylate kinase [Luminiphilus sp.]